MSGCGMTNCPGDSSSAYCSMCNPEPHNWGTQEVTDDQTYTKLIELDCRISSILAMIQRIEEKLDKLNG